MNLRTPVLWPTAKLLLCQILCVLFIFPALCENIADAHSITLAWNANQEPNLVAYKLYYSVAASTPTTCDQGPSPITIPLLELKDHKAPALTLTGLAGDRTYHFKITAVNDLGQESGFSDTLTLHLASSTGTEITSKFEVNEISVNHNWQRIVFQQTYRHPVVVAGPPSLNDEAPAVVRIDHVTGNGFDLCLEEWDYLDDRHDVESIGYLAMESGVYRLSDGPLIVADTLATSPATTYARINFGAEFKSVPVLCATATTFNGAETITVRIRHIDIRGFELTLQQQESNAPTGETETISYIAWEPSLGKIGTTAYEVNKTPQNITHEKHLLYFQTRFSSSPSMISALQTCNGRDTASLRWQDKTAYFVYLQITEEQSQDPEIVHVDESVGYMLFEIDG